MMNTTTTIDKATNNQNAFNYAVYMMLGSYFKQMEAVSVEVEGLSAAQGMLLAVADQHDAAFDDIAEFLAVMRLDREALAALGQLEQYRLHLILLRVGNDPVDRAVLALVDEEIVGVEDELVVFILLKELGKIRAERLQNVAQRVDGRGGKVAL